eukprot:gene8643-17828_t
MDIWKGFHEKSGLDEIFSVIECINGKVREGVLICEILSRDEEKFELFFICLVNCALDRTKPLDGDLLVSYTALIIELFRSLEVPIIRKCVLRTVSLPIWRALSSSRLSCELDSNPQISRHWAHLEEVKAEKINSKKTDPLPKKKATGGKKRKKSDPVAEVATEQKSDVEVDWEAEWIPELLRQYMSIVESIREDTMTPTQILYVERFTEFIIDLLSQLPTRRFFFTLFDDMHVLVRCRRSHLISLPNGQLFNQLLDMISTYAHFEVDNHTGKVLTSQDVLAEQNSRLHKLQQIAFSEYGDSLKDLAFSSTGELGKVGTLKKYLGPMNDTQLGELTFKLGYISKIEYEAFTTKLSTTTSTNNILENNSNYSYITREFLFDLLFEILGHRQSQLELMTQIPICPSEELLWNVNQIPKGTKYTGNEVLALPKLNLQFLHLHDYLLRNFILFRLESAYEIREDLVDAIKRMGPRVGVANQVTFGGWARMASPIVSLNIDEVSKPNLGEIVPAFVTATVTIDLSRFKGEIRSEWESLRQHDVIFLACIRNPKAEVNEVLQTYASERALLSKGRKTGKRRDFQWAEEDLDFPSRYGVQYIRGGEVFELKDEDNVVLNDFSRPDERKSGRIGSKRKIRIRLDAAQYYADMKAGRECYDGLNLLIRRKSKENNFKAVLETIRDLMNMAAVGRAVPSWLYDVFLGYGNPASANYRNISNRNEDMDYYDTFLDGSHLFESFPNTNITFHTPTGDIIPMKNTATTDMPTPPYRIQITGSSKNDTDDGVSTNVKDQLTVMPYHAINMGPYPEDQRPTNSVRFTPVQIEAIRSGLNP